MDVQLRPTLIVLNPPVQTARGAIGERPAVIVELTDDDGHQGRGEAAPLPGWSTASSERVAEELDQWARAQAATPGPVPVGGDVSSEARAAIDSAVWTLRASQSGQPLCELLGAPRGTTSVPVNALVSQLEPHEVGAATRRAVAEGYRTLKVKAGFGDDRARFQAVHDAIDADTLVRIDVNCALAVDDATELAEFATSLFGTRLEYLEDAGQSVADLKIIGARTTAPLAVDELAHTSADLERSVDIDQVVAVVVKPALIGGITQARTLAARANAAGADVVVSSLYDGVVGLTAWCHLAAALGTGRAHGLGTATLLPDPAAASLVPRGGYVMLP